MHSRTEQAVDYRALAELRFQIRRFLRFSETAARRAGIEPQQHQLLLALKGLEGEEGPTIGDLARRLLIRHHSVVELIDRLEDRGLVRRHRSEGDRRRVCAGLTPEGERVLEALSVEHHAELDSAGPALLTALEALLRR
jgi:DNA-binding MarR family transcriptional regulator